MMILRDGELFDERGPVLLTFHRPVVLDWVDPWEP
jgi:hypothetical protein